MLTSNSAVRALIYYLETLDSAEVRVQVVDSEAILSCILFISVNFLLFIRTMSANLLLSSFSLAPSGGGFSLLLFKSIQKIVSNAKKSFRLHYIKIFMLKYCGISIFRGSHYPTGIRLCFSRFNDLF